MIVPTFHAPKGPCRSAVLAMLLALTLAGCARAPEELSNPTQFFRNSTRRDPTESEKRQVVKVGPGCTAFFVENTKNLTLMISARHCFDYRATAWCAAQSPVEDNVGAIGSCEELAAGDGTHDIVLFKVSMPYPLDASRTMRLADFTPAVNTQLKMIGYPGDKFRQRALTVIESCWIMSGAVPSPYPVHMGITDLSARHNCTTYGGNSGGPMLAKGTRIAVGLPFTYQKDDYTERAPDSIETAAHLALMSAFVANNREKLLDLGVVLSSSVSDPGAQSAEPDPRPSPGQNPIPSPSPTQQQGDSRSGACICSADRSGSRCTLSQNEVALAWSQIEGCDRSLCQQLFASSITERCGGTFTMGQER